VSQDKVGNLWVALHPTFTDSCNKIRIPEQGYPLLKFDVKPENFACEKTELPGIIGKKSQGNSHQTITYAEINSLLHLQVSTLHDGCKQGIDQRIFDRKSISRKLRIRSPYSHFNKD